MINYIFKKSDYKVFLCERYMVKMLGVLVIAGMMSIGAHADVTCPDGNCQTTGCTTNSDCPAGYFCADTNESCTETHPNKCQKFDFVHKTITLSDGTSETWYASTYWLSWWDAENACKKLGKRLATADEMVEGFDKTKSWGNYTRTERAEKLYEAFGGDSYYWLSDSYNSCHAFRVGLSSGSVGTNGRRNYARDNLGFLALCR